MTLPTETHLLNPGSPIYLQAANALVGSSPELKKNLLIGISGGVVDSIKPLPPKMPDNSFFAGRPLIKLDDSLFLLPALIDAHVHLALNGSGFSRARQQWDNEEQFYECLRKDLQKYARAGIGLLRDGGDFHALNIKARKFVEQGLFPAPQIIASGKALRRIGGYGGFLGPGFATAAGLTEHFEELYFQDVDYIKVVVSGVVSFSEYGLVGGPLIEAQYLQQIVSLAGGKGLKVMAHASSDQAVRLAVEAGVSSIEHGYFVGDDSLKAMAEKEIVWIPTVIPVAARIQGAGGIGRRDEEIEIINRIIEVHLQKIALANRFGVPLGMGTDSGAAGLPHGSALHDEIELYRQAGLSAAEIIKAATLVNARIAGCGENGGMIEVGSPAGMIAVCGNPLNDLRCLRKLRYHFIPAVEKKCATERDHGAGKYEERN